MNNKLSFIKRILLLLTITAIGATDILLDNVIFSNRKKKCKINKKKWHLFDVEVKSLRERERRKETVFSENISIKKVKLNICKTHIVVHQIK